MLVSNYTPEILNLQDVRVEKVENLKKKQRIFIKLVQKAVTCPAFRAQTSKINDYRTQIVKDVEAFWEESWISIIKEWFFRVLDTEDLNDTKQEFKNRLNSVDTTDLKPFKRCVNTYFNRKNGILNSLEAPFTNGFTEGCNNKIKVLKRNAYGYRRFDRFRNRILYIFSHQNAA